jgi:glycosyltransferase involved in cell wall biosynthesis
MRQRSLPTADELNWDKARAALGAEGNLSIILPCYRLETVIAENLRRVAATFRGKLPFSIIAVDDGSGDQTSEQLHSIQSDIPEMEIVELKDNQGKGHALREGFKAARGSHIMFLDADLDLPPYQACWFLEEMADSGADIVIGAKRHPRSELVYPMKRRIISAIYYMIVRLLFGLPVRDTQTGIKLFRRAALETVLPRMLVKRFAFDLELLGIAHALGFRIAEAPVTLSFHEPYGCVTARTVKNIFNDTLAIFYRLRILHYYQSLRPIPAPASTPLVSVVIACPGPSPYLEECLRGLADQQYKNFEALILPDQPSGKTWPSWAREIATGPQRPAEKRNRGIRAAHGTVVAFIDDDATPAAEWLAEAVRSLADPAIGAVGGPGVTPPNDPFLAQLGGRVFASPIVSGRSRYRYTPTRVRESDDLPSCNLLVRKKTLDAIGGFRTDFWPGEDTVLCLEIVKRGETILYNPHVLVYHHRRKLFAPHLRQVGRYALHRGFFVRRFPQTSFRLPYMMPSALLLGILAGAAVAGLYPPLRVWYVVGVLAYLLLTGAAAFPLEALLVSMRLPLRAWILTWLGVMATHGVYGFRFLCGLLARRMPENIDSFDHVSESRP